MRDFDEFIKLFLHESNWILTTMVPGGNACEVTITELLSTDNAALTFP